MARHTDHRIYVNFAGQETQQMQGSGQARIRAHMRDKNSEAIMKVSFKRTAALALGIRMGRMANEVIGAYTGDRLRQRRIKTGIQLGSYAIGIAKFGVFGLAYVAGDLGYRTAMYNIDIQKKNREARHMRHLSGINVEKISRYSGEML